MTRYIINDENDRVAPFAVRRDPQNSDEKHLWRANILRLKTTKSKDTSLHSEASNCTSEVSQVTEKRN